MSDMPTTKIHNARGESCTFCSRGMVMDDFPEIRRPYSKTMNIRGAGPGGRTSVNICSRCLKHINSEGKRHGFI